MRVVSKYIRTRAQMGQGIELLQKDSPCFWEMSGCSNSADPWKEERYCEDS